VTRKLCLCAFFRAASVPSVLVRVVNPFSPKPLSPVKR
jgi:hypothetical protein